MLRQSLFQSRNTRTQIRMIDSQFKSFKQKSNQVSAQLSPRDVILRRSQQKQPIGHIFGDHFLLALVLRIHGQVGQRQGGVPKHLRQCGGLASAQHVVQSANFDQFCVGVRALFEEAFKERHADSQLLA